MLTFMLTCVTCTSHVTSLGWGGGDVNVHVNLRHMHISRYVTGLEGGGDVNVHVSLRHMHISRYVTGLGGGDVNVNVNLRLSKSAVPCSPPTRSNGHVNPKLMRSIRVWQWRWMNSTTKGLMEVTGQALKNRMAM